MSVTSNILLVGNIGAEIKNFQSKLMLLRGVDSLQTAAFGEAVKACRQYIPDTMIVFSEDKNEQIFEILKAIRKDSIIKNTPVLIILDKYDEEFIISCFDAGIDDYIVSPAMQADILTRTIWCLKKSEILRDLDKKENLLSELQILDKQTGIYSKTAESRVIENEIYSANKYKYPIALMAITLNTSTKSNLDNIYLGDKIKKSVRHADTICSLDDGVFYAILAKTDLKGINAVYQRILSNVSSEFIISAGACAAFGNIDTTIIKKTVKQSLEDALGAKENKLIIKEYQTTSDNWLDKVQDNQKNYKFFKQVFSKKLQNIIIPVFEKAQERLSYIYQEHSKIYFNTGETSCEFVIANTEKQIETVIKLTDTGLPKTIVDCFYAQGELKTSRRSAINLQELNEENLALLLEKLHKKFQEMLGI